MIKVFRIIFLGIILVSTSVEVYAQNKHKDHFHHGRNELGISIGGLYTINDKEWGSAIHLHYFRSLADHSPWSIGGFFEQSLFLDSHFSVGVGTKFIAFEKLELGVFPGISFSKHSHAHADGDEQEEEKKTESKFSVHAELSYILFEWDSFHLGPAVDYSWSKGDSHFMLGIHSAFSF